MKNRIFIILITLFLTANAGYCISHTVKEALTKFSLAMFGVIISSVIIFVGLTVYNKIRSKTVNEISPEEEIFKTPKNIDDAIRFFIRKNKLK